MAVAAALSVLMADTLQVVVLVPQLSNPSWTQAPRWMRFLGHNADGNVEDAHPSSRANARLMIDEGDEVAVEGQYRDEVGGSGQGGAAGAGNTNEEGSRARVVPSGLVGDGGQQWRDDA